MVTQVQEWNYKSEDPSIKHIGPVAQDFYAAFNVGNNNTSISTIDPAGIALLGIQALSHRLDSLASSTLMYPSVTDSSSLSDTLSFTAGQVVNGVVHYSEIIATLGIFTHVQTTDIEITGGMMIHDAATGDTYCVRILNGEWDKSKGTCNSLQKEQGSSSPTAAATAATAATTPSAPTPHGTTTPTARPSSADNTQSSSTQSTPQQSTSSDPTTRDTSVTSAGATTTPTSSDLTSSSTAGL